LQSVLTYLLRDHRVTLQNLSGTKTEFLVSIIVKRATLITLRYENLLAIFEAALSDINKFPMPLGVHKSST
jgi:hypothetical protein